MQALVVADDGDHLATLRTAATATLALHLATITHPGWATDALDLWLCRAGRGHLAALGDVATEASVPHRVVTARRAAVLALPPAPAQGLPPDIARLLVPDLDLRHGRALPDGAAEDVRVPAAAGDVLLCVAEDLTTGRACAAGIGALRSLVRSGGLDARPGTTVAVHLVPPAELRTAAGEPGAHVAGTPGTGAVAFAPRRARHAGRGPRAR
ncbi:hypothetical protein [Oerskovia flava]|uniref:hypothetical protein n=1 Tax=Oerskovia flava TaxID=2986422 RepID=UPI0022406A03|nr:hypothetical protein [Oerskovia sp. JB1-3-2]